MPGESKGDTKSKGCKTDTINALSNLSFCTKRSMRYTGREYTRRRVVHNNRKKEEGRPPGRGGEQDKNNQQRCHPKHLQLFELKHARCMRDACDNPAG